jgi:hypothetical protein
MAAVIKAKLKVSRYIYVTFIHQSSDISLSREAISNKDYRVAQKAAEEVLTYDASNYHG